MEVKLTDDFLDRIKEFTDYIARDNVPIALKWQRGVIEKCLNLKNHPEIGRIVPEFNQSGIRELIHGNYRLIYELKTDKIDMLTIWHIRQRSSEDKHNN